MTLQTSQDRISAFFSWLQSRREDRAVMAELRRGFSPGTEHYAWKHLASWFDLKNARLRTIYTTVAACYALHPQTTDQESNLGATLRHIALSQHGAGKEALESYEGRLRRLLACPRAIDVCRHLRQIVTLAKHHAAPVDYRRLLRDLLSWDRPSAKVKARWAAEYWKLEKENPDDALSHTNSD